MHSTCSRRAFSPTLPALLSTLFLLFTLALPHAAQAHRRQRLRSQFHGIDVHPFHVSETEQHIVERRTVRQKAEALEHHPDLAFSHRAESAVVHGRDTRSVEHHLPCRGGIHERRQIQQGRFPGTGWTGDEDKLARLNNKIDMTEHFHGTGR